MGKAAAAKSNGSPRNDLHDRIMYVIIRLTAISIHALPTPVCQIIAQNLGRLWYRLDKRHADRARGNVRNCFPDFSPEKCDRVARESVEHLFMFAYEVLFTTRLIHIDSWRKYIELENIEQTVRLLVQKNRGLIFLTAHFGNWEILGYVVATLGFETTSVARQMNNPYLNDWLLGVRQRRGQRVVDKRGAVMEVADLLADGGTVAFVADQNAGPKGIFVDFFGRKASTYKSIGLLAMQFSVPIVVCYAKRLESPFTFRIGTQDIIYPADWENEADPLRYITQRYTKAVEDFIRKDPAQYTWMHRRWATRPKGETPLPFD